MACRKRFEIILSNSDRVKSAHNKITEYLAKQVEMTEEEMAKKKVMVHETKVEKDGMDVERMRAQGGTNPDLGRDIGGGTAASSGLMKGCRAGGRTAAR